MPYKAYIFDLDGTLLDTLSDLVRLTNMVLDEHGWPRRTRDEILSFVGNGGRNLLERAAPLSTPPDELDRAFERWQRLYPKYGHATTRPYDGIPEALARLKSDDARLAVLSNKFDTAVQQVIGDQFPGVFDLARGECAEIPRKPDPTGLRLIMSQLDVQPYETVYVGDSASDVAVAKNAGVRSVAVTWGYRSRETLLAAHPDTLVDTPHSLLDV